MVSSPVVIARNNLPLWPVASYSERSPPEKIPLSSFNHFRIRHEILDFFQKKVKFENDHNEIGEMSHSARFPPRSNSSETTFSTTTTEQQNLIVGETLQTTLKTIFSICLFWIFDTSQIFQLALFEILKCGFMFFSHLPRWWPVGIGYKRS